jgi:hypothetical protein
VFNRGGSHGKAKESSGSEKDDAQTQSHAHCHEAEKDGEENLDGETRAAPREARCCFDDALI